MFEKIHVPTLVIGTAVLTVLQRTYYEQKIINMKARHIGEEMKMHSRGLRTGWNRGIEAAESTDHYQGRFIHLKFDETEE